MTLSPGTAITKKKHTGSNLKLNMKKKLGGMSKIKIVKVLEICV